VGGYFIIDIELLGTIDFKERLLFIQLPSQDIIEIKGIITVGPQNDVPITIKVDRSSGEVTEVYPPRVYPPRVDNWVTVGTRIANWLLLWWVILSFSNWLMLRDTELRQRERSGLRQFLNLAR
jgi:hypothetical protein